MVSFFGNRDFAFVGVFLADDHAEERGLAGAVGTDQADLLAGVQLKGGVDEDQLLAVLLVDVGKGDQTTKLADDPDRHFRRFIERFLESRISVPHDQERADSKRGHEDSDPEGSWKIVKLYLMTAWSHDHALKKVIGFVHRRILPVH